jgi:predicted MFS family arabinose efflux permease
MDIGQSSMRWWHGAAPASALSPGRRVYTLIMMGLVTALAVVDRNILNILLTPIQSELGASDTAMGLLTGTAFAVFYVTAAVPLARLADLGNRRNLLSASLLVWSFATTISGTATSYVHLLLARIGVAAGEASSNPAIMSIISDIYPPNRRATAIGATLVGTGVGILIGSALGGYFAETLGWRAAFVAVGVPGIILAVIMWLTVPEPMRGGSEGGLREDPDSRSTWSVLQYLARIPSFLHMVLGKSTLQIGSQASLIWTPTYLIRVHDWSLAKTGLFYGVTLALATTSAALIGGPLADRLARRRGPGWYLYFSSAAVVLAIPLALGIITASSGIAAIVFIFFYATILGCQNTPAMAAVLEVVRPRMRGFTTAIINLVFNLVGAGLGGFLIGLLNDRLSAVHGDHAIRYSMLLIPASMVVGTVFYLLGARTMDQDVRAARQT